MVVEYAHALKKSTEGLTTTEANKRFSRFMDVLKKEGKLKALPGVLRELVRITEKEAAQAPTLYVAHEKRSAQAKKELKVLLDTDAAYETAVDDKLIGGWRYVGGDTLIDQSHKKALLTLYRNITKA